MLKGENMMTDQVSAHSTATNNNIVITSTSSSSQPSHDGAESHHIHHHSHNHNQHHHNVESNSDQPVQTNSKPKIDVAVVIDLQIKNLNLPHRLAAFEEIERACHIVNANCHTIAFHKLDFDELNATEAFYSADVAIVDFSIRDQQHSLFYRIGNRENFGMKHNILIYNDDSSKVTIPHNLPIPLNLISYRQSTDKKCYVTEPVTNIKSDASNRPLSSETKIQLSTKLRNALQDVQIQTKTHFKEKFLTELKKARDTLTGDELIKALNEFRRKLTNPSLIASDVIHNLLVSFREVQDYNSMVGLIEELQPNSQFQFTPLIQYLYAFALSRRNMPGDRDDLNNSQELQSVASALNILMGRKGNIKLLQDYWDVATFFEISVLAENYSKAIEAAECMFNLKPPGWYLKSTVRNICLINEHRKKPEDARISAEEQMFQFWMEFFMEAAKDEPSYVIRYPVIILEIDKTIMPSHVTVNMDDQDGRSLEINNVNCKECLRETSQCKRPHRWLFQSSKIRGLSMYKSDQRCLFLYVISDDFQLFFPSEEIRQRFYEQILELTANDECVTDLDARKESDSISFEYVLNDFNERVKLGEGSYGTVYSARDRVNRDIAVKEIQIKNTDEVQPLQEEIKLHSQLNHRNIVKYIGSIHDETNGVFKILMESVPGGSLSQLLRAKWGPLKESVISYYTRQILEGIHYLHSQNIVHRDIKGDNVLVNTYTGVVKISDFGTSKRLAGLHPKTETFTGTFQYMAPEVIDQGSRGYSAPADIWSLGCTMVEMATGKTPFIEVGSGQEVIFKVGFFKEHPEIPSTLSDKCRAFIQRCFIPESSKRPTAAELLDDPFLENVGTRKRKTLGLPSNNTSSNSSNTSNNSMNSQSSNTYTSGSNLSTNYNGAIANCTSATIGGGGCGGNMNQIDFNRSVSMPHDMSTNGDEQHQPNSAEILMNDMNPMPTTKPKVNRLEPKLSLNIKDSHNNGFGTMQLSSIAQSPSIMSEDRSPGIFYSPTPNIMDTPFYDSDHDNFFIKNSQNIEKNLAQVIKNNEEEICNVWLRRLLENWPETTLMLKHCHLKNILLPGLRDFISTNQNLLYLSNALNLLAKEFDELINLNSNESGNEMQTQQQQNFVGNTDGRRLLVKQIQTAIYYFQDAIDSILKIQNIPPHWIFALDSSIRTTVQTGVNLLYQNFKTLFNIDDIDSVNTETNLSGTLYNRQNSCLTNMNGSQQSLEDDIMIGRQMKDQLKQLIQENQKTVTMLSDTFAEYLKEQNQMFRNLFEQVTNAKSSIQMEHQLHQHPHQPKQEDSDMIKFLRAENISQQTIDTLIEQDISLQVMLEFMTRDDIGKLGLTLGDELQLPQFSFPYTNNESQQFPSWTNNVIMNNERLQYENNINTIVFENEQEIEDVNMGIEYEYESDSPPYDPSQNQSLLDLDFQIHSNRNENVDEEDYWRKTRDCDYRLLREKDNNNDVNLNDEKMEMQNKINKKKKHKIIKRQDETVDVDLKNVDDLPYEELISVYQQLKEELTLLSCDESNTEVTKSNSSPLENEVATPSVNSIEELDDSCELIYDSRLDKEEQNKLDKVLENDSEQLQFNVIMEHEHSTQNEISHSLNENKIEAGLELEHSVESSSLEQTSNCNKKLEVIEIDHEDVDVQFNPMLQSIATKITSILPRKPLVDLSKFRLVIQVSDGEDESEEERDSNVVTKNSSPSTKGFIHQLSKSQQEEYRKLKLEIERREAKMITFENLHKCETNIADVARNMNEKHKKIGLLKNNARNTQNKLIKTSRKIKNLENALLSARKQNDLLKIELQMNNKELNNVELLCKGDEKRIKHYQTLCMKMGKRLIGQSYQLPVTTFGRKRKKPPTTITTNENTKTKVSNKESELSIRYLRTHYKVLLKTDSNYEAAIPFDQYVSFNFSLFKSSLFCRTNCDFLIEFNEFTEKNNDILQSCDLKQIPEPFIASSGTEKQYQSVLQHFNSYRFASHQKLNITADCWSNALNPNQFICIYELFGVCNDSNCKFQHQKDYIYGPQEKIIDVLTYLPHINGQENSKDNPKAFRQTLLNYVQDRMSKSDSIETICKDVSKDIKNQSKTSVSTFLRRFLPKELVNFSENVSPLSKQVEFDDYHYRFYLTDEDFRMKLNTLRLEKDPDFYLKNRFFAPEGVPISAELEASLAIDPLNIQKWINLAYCYMRPKNGREFDDLNGSIDSSLNVLSRALEANRKNPELYEQYLLFYSQKVELHTSDMINANDNCSNIIPIETICERILKKCSNYRLWVCYVNLTHDLKKKTQIVLRMIYKFNSGTIQSNNESKDITEIILFRIHLLLQSNQHAQAVQYFHKIFEEYNLRPSGMKLYSKISKDHQVFSWLCYIHLILYQCLPYHSFQLCKKTSFLYLVNVRPFVFNWESITSQNDLFMIERVFNRAINSCCLYRTSNPSEQNHKSLCGSTCFPLRFNLAQLNMIMQRMCVNDQIDSESEITNSYSYLSTIYNENFDAVTHLHILQLFDLKFSNDDIAHTLLLNLMETFYNGYNQRLIIEAENFSDDLLGKLRNQIQFNYWLAFYNYKCRNVSKCREILLRSLSYYFNDSDDLFASRGNNSEFIFNLFELILLDNEHLAADIYQRDEIRKRWKFGPDRRPSRLVYFYLSYLLYLHIDCQKKKLLAEQHYLKLDCVFSSIVNSFTSSNLNNHDEYKFLWLNYFLILLEFPFSKQHFRLVYETLRHISVTFNSSDPNLIYHLTNTFSELIKPQDRLYFLIELSKLNVDNTNLIIKIVNLALNQLKKETLWQYINYIVYDRKIRLRCFEFWKIAISLSIERNDHLNTHKFFQIAVNAIPYNALLWEMLKNYESSINHTEHLGQLKKFYNQTLKMSNNLFEN
ncbi:hypothetical protein BLOT_001550 [Blomia tropicalis]|nr:hypothetical protein BLOT_001550 [Blomia tropicalis]